VSSTSSWSTRSISIRAKARASWIPLIASSYGAFDSHLNGQTAPVAPKILLPATPYPAPESQPWLVLVPNELTTRIWVCRPGGVVSQPWALGPYVRYHPETIWEFHATFASPSTTRPPRQYCAATRACAGVSALDEPLLLWDLVGRRMTGYPPGSCSGSDRHDAASRVRLGDGPLA